MSHKHQKLIWYLIFTQALLAMLGSLYFSNFGDPVLNIIDGYPFPWGSGFYPCRLCWWARIMMYPLVAISAVGIWRKNPYFTNYILPLSIPGMFLEVYHYFLQKVPTATSEGCTLGNPCDAFYVNYFGFITIPFLAFIAFMMINILCVINMRINRKKSK